MISQSRRSYVYLFHVYIYIVHIHIHTYTYVCVLYHGHTPLRHQRLVPRELDLCSSLQQGPQKIT